MLFSAWSTVQQHQQDLIFCRNKKHCFRAVIPSWRNFCLRGGIGDIFGCYSWGWGCRRILVGRGQGCRSAPSVAQDRPHSKESSDRKCQWCGSWETLIKGKWVGNSRVGVGKVKRKCFKMINNRSKRERETLAKESWNLGCDHGDFVPLGKSFTLSQFHSTHFIKCGKRGKRLNQKNGIIIPKVLFR